MDSSIDLQALAKKQGFRKLGVSLAVALVAVLLVAGGFDAPVFRYVTWGASLLAAWSFVAGALQIADPTRRMKNLGAAAMERRQALAEASEDLSRPTTLRVPTDKGWALVGLKWLAIHGPLGFVVAERREVADVTTARDGAGSEVAVHLRSGRVLHVKKLPSSTFFAQAVARVLTTPAPGDHFFSSGSSGASTMG